MGKISDYTRVLAAKLADVFVVDQTDNGTTETKSATVEQIGTAIGTLQNFADLDTSNKKLVDAINEIASYTPVYNNTASGAIATFDTSLALPLQDCTIDINAVQESGTPTPSSPKLISGFTGANIVNVSDYSTYFKGIYDGSYGFIDLGNVTWSRDTTTRPVDGATVHAFYTVISGAKKVGNTEIGNLLLNGFTTDTVRNVDYGGYDVVKDKIVGGGDNNSRVWVYDSEYNDYNTTEFRTAMSGKYLIYELETPTTPTITTAQFNTLCTAFDISGVVYPISWQDEAGTVYGGYFRIVNGIVKLMVTWGGSDMSTFTWTYSSTNTRWYTSALKDIAVLIYNHPTFKAEQWNTHVWSGATEGDIVCDGSGILYCNTNDNSNQPAGLIIYELKTPVEYTLASVVQPSAIVGTNNIFTDTNGNTSVVYACSLKDYIDSQ